MDCLAPGRERVGVLDRRHPCSCRGGRCASRHPCSLCRGGRSAAGALARSAARTARHATHARGVLDTRRLLPPRPVPHAMCAPTAGNVVLRHVGLAYSSSTRGARRVVVAWPTQLAQALPHASS